MSDFDRLYEEIENGMNGNNLGLSMGYDRLNKYIGIRKRIYTLVFGPTGCHAKGTKICMFDGSFKNVENIVVGDQLMGPDSKIRNVLEFKTGSQQMYKIIQNKGITYEVNEDHILSLRKLTKGKFEYINIPVKEYIKKSNSFKHLWKGYKTSIDFPEKNLEIDPYFLGLWLGDGTSCKTEITTSDAEIVRYLFDFCKENDLLLNRHKKDNYNYNLVCKNRGVPRNNKLLNFLKDFNLICNKHIPEIYLKNSKNNRLSLLAGLIDSDGSKDSNGGYTITLKDKNLADQVTYLCRSLGFYTSNKLKKARMRRKDNTIYECDVRRLTINGNNLYEIPCRIERKKIKKKSSRVSDALSTGFKVVPTKIDTFYGFSLDGDNLYLLEDFTVTHNSGKTAYVHNSYILNPYEDFISKGKGKFKVILFSMERSKIYTIAKWLSRKIFMSEGILIPIPKMMGWWKDKLTEGELLLIKKYKYYIDDLLKYVDIIEGAQNPTGIYKYLEQYAENPLNGKKNRVSEFHSIYNPVDPTEIIIPIIDHIGLVKPEKGQNKKEAIDKTSEYMQKARDFWGYSPVVVSQVNRDLSNPIYQKMGSFEPTIDNAKESGRPSEDSDNVVSIWDPRRYNTTDPSYDIEKFVDQTTGANYFRSVKILKNSYGEDSIRVGMGFHGATGTFKELPKPGLMEGFNYENLYDGTFFY